jgi:hypothetical protein
VPGCGTVIVLEAPLSPHVVRPPPPGAAANSESSVVNG